MNGLTIRGLGKCFGTDRVLDGVDLDVDEGTSTAILGPSGCGKSTLLRCVTGLVSFDEGSIRVAGLELRPTASPEASLRAATPIRQRVGMVFQDYRLFPHRTALENVAEAPIQVRGVSPREALERARALLERVGLAARADAYPRSLSGGQQQRVAIARALAMDPVALLCDEVTSALDPERTLEVLEVLDGLRREGMTLVLVTHELEVARRIADRVAFVAEGKVLEHGLTAEILRAAKHPRTRRFLGDRSEPATDASSTRSSE